MHVLGRADQGDDGEVDLDEVREVAELEEPAQLLEVARHGARVACGELADDPRRGRADVVDVQLGLGQSGDEVGRGPCHRAESPAGRRAPRQPSTQDGVSDWSPRPWRTRVTPVNDRLVWIDCEMTGLDLEADALIEVAALVTDFDLNVLGDGVDLVVGPPAAALEQMDDFVRDMHANSGLLDELAGGITLADAEEQVLAYVREHCAERQPPAAGRQHRRHRPDVPRARHAELEAFLHYRIVDVSSIKELSRRWFPRAYYKAPAKRGNHRALADIQESIEELRYYREAVFVPPPGPDADTAQAIAARHGGRSPGRRREPPRTARGPGAGPDSRGPRLTGLRLLHRPGRRPGPWWV